MCTVYLSKRVVPDALRPPRRWPLGCRQVPPTRAALSTWETGFFPAMSAQGVHYDKACNLLEDLCPRIFRLAAAPTPFSGSLERIVPCGQAVVNVLELEELYAFACLFNVSFRKRLSTPSLCESTTIVTFKQRPDPKSGKM